MKSFFKSSTPVIDSTTVPNLKKAKKIVLAFVLSVAYVGAMAQTNMATGNVAIWTGAAGAEWQVAANWNTSKIPDETTNTVIPAGISNMPVIGTASYNARTANLTVQPGATLTITANRTLNLFGNLLNADESRYIILGRINFAGADQLIPGFTYNSIAISGGGTKTLSGNAIVNGMFILVKGIVKTDNQHMLTMGSQAMVTSGHAASYIDGPLTRITNTTYDFSFPVGNNGVVKNVIVTPNEETMSAFTVSYHKANVDGISKIGSTNLLAIKTDEYYEVKKTVGSAGASLKAEYLYEANASQWSNNQLPGEEENVAMVVNDNNQWRYQANAAYGLNNIESVGAITSEIVASPVLLDNARYAFAYGYASIDSIHILQLNATLVNYSAAVNWSLKQGNDAIKTELETSTDNARFEALYNTVCANGMPFSFNQSNLSVGVHYYRLKMTDKGGNVSYSPSVSVVMPVLQTIITGLKATQVRYDGYVQMESAKNQQVALVLFDMAGHTINKQSTAVAAGKNSVHFNSMNITPGIYNLYVQTTDGVAKTLRFMKE